jgi:hypothetical protein
MKKRLFLILSLMVALAITAISFANTSTTTSVDVSVGASNFFNVKAAKYGDPTPANNVAGKHGRVPNWSPVQGTSGSLTQSGDLFVLEPGTYNGDGWVYLYLNNADKLSKAYSYLNMNIKVYEKVSGATDWTGATALSDVNAYLTLTNGYVAFKIKATPGSSYSVSLDGASFYTINTSVTDNLKPSFYIEVK